jgi:hypothetical protein
MTDRFMSAVLTALNESADAREGDWHAIELALRGSLDPVDLEPQQVARPYIAENRFAATISCGMAKIRSGL